MNVRLVFTGEVLITDAISPVQVPVAAAAAAAEGLAL